MYDLEDEMFGVINAGIAEYDEANFGIGLTGHCSTVQAEIYAPYVPAVRHVVLPINRAFFEKTNISLIDVFSPKPKTRKKLSSR